MTLNAGDTVYYDASALQSERNDGKEDAFVLISNARGTDEPARIFHEEMAAVDTAIPAA